MISTNEWSILNRWMNYDEECCEISVIQFMMMKMLKLNECWNKCCDEVCDEISVTQFVAKDLWKYVMKYLSLNLLRKICESMWWNICHSICCESLLKVCWKYVMHDGWKFVEESFPDFDECCEVNVVKWMLWSECCEVNVKFVHHISFIICVNML